MKGRKPRPAPARPARAAKRRLRVIYGLLACLALLGAGCGTREVRKSDGMAPDDSAEAVAAAGAPDAGESAGGDEEPAWEDEEPAWDDEEPAWDDQDEVKPISDPLEPVNRAFFVFNDKLYFWVLKPVSWGYAKVVPEGPRKGVRKFFSNLSTPVRTVNCLLQGDLKGSGTELARFGINTTAGVLGFWDPALGWGIPKRPADLALVLMMKVSSCPKTFLTAMTSSPAFMPNQLTSKRRVSPPL